MVHGSPRGLRGWQRGHRPSGPDPGNAGGGKVERESAATTRWSSEAGSSASAAPGALAQARRAGRRARARRPAAGATRVAAGMLAPVGELAFGEPELLRADPRRGRALPGLRRRARGGERGRRPATTRCGALHVALDRDEAEELRRVHDLQRSLGLGAEWLPPRGCRELEPGLTPVASTAASTPPSEAAVDPRRADARRCSRRSPREGVEVRTGDEVAEALLDGERIDGRAHRRRRGAARRRASSSPAGAWSGAAEWLPEQARPPVRPVKGQILELRAPRRRSRPASGSSPPSGSTWCRAPTAA